MEAFIVKDDGELRRIERAICRVRSATADGALTQELPPAGAHAERAELLRISPQRRRMSRHQTLRPIRANRRRLTLMHVNVLLPQKGLTAAV